MSQFNQENLKHSAELLRALAHPLRLAIVKFVDKHKVINVNKIYNTLKLEQSITSQHLRILRNVGLVETKREGKFIYYSLNYKKLAYINKRINSFLDEDKKGRKKKK